MLKSIFSGVLGSIITILAQIISTFFITHLIIKYLRPDYASAWFLFYSLAQLIYIFDFGLSPTLAREIAFIHTKDGINIKKLYSILSTSIGLSFILGIVIFLLFLIIGDYYLSHIFHGLDVPIILHSYLYFLSGAFFLFLNIPLLAIHYGFGHVFTERLLRTATLLVSVVTLFIFFKWSNDFQILCLCWLVVNFILHILVRIYTGIKFKISLFQFKISKIVAKNIMINGSQQGMIALGAWIIFQIGYFIIAKELGASYVSQYVPLMQLAMGIMMLANFLQYSSSPFISRLYIQGERNKVVNYLQKLNQIVMIIAIFSAAFLLCNAALIFKYWLGSSFLYSPWTFKILLLMVMLEINHVSWASGAISCGYLKFSKLAWLAAILSFVLGVVLVRFYGIMGVALGLFLAQLLTNNWGAIFLSLRFFKIPASVYLSKLAWIPLYTAVLYMISKMLEVFITNILYRFYISIIVLGFGLMMTIIISFKEDLQFIWSSLRGKSTTV
jgi:O-antigen/teichoic acid export membrane protein